MLRWLKNLLRQWLQEEDTSTTLDILVSGEIKRVLATGTMGMRLVCVIPASEGSESQYLAARNQACDRRQYDRIWKQLGGATLTWEDGTPVELPR